MRLIEGFVCDVTLAEHPRDHRLFGKNTGEGQGFYEALTTNGLTPFLNLNDANQGYEELFRRNSVFIGIDIAKLRMNLAEKDEEVENLNGYHNLVVVMYAGEDGTHLLGRYIKGAHHIGYIPGSLLESNGFCTIPTLERAYHIASSKRGTSSGRLSS